MPSPMASPAQRDALQQATVSGVSANPQETLAFLNGALRQAYASGNMAMAQAIEQRIDAVNAVAAEQNTGQVPLAPAMPPNPPVDALPPPAQAQPQSALPETPPLVRTGNVPGDVMGNIERLAPAGNYQLRPAVEMGTAQTPREGAFMDGPPRPPVPPLNAPNRGQYGNPNDPLMAGPTGAAAAMPQSAMPGAWPPFEVQRPAPPPVATVRTQDRAGNVTTLPEDQVRSDWWRDLRGQGGALNAERDSAWRGYRDMASSLLSELPGARAAREVLADPAQPNDSVMPPMGIQPPPVNRNIQRDAMPPVGGAEAGVPLAPSPGSPANMFQPGPAPWAAQPPAPLDALSGRPVVSDPLLSPGPVAAPPASAMPAIAGSATPQRGGLSDQIPTTPPTTPPAATYAERGMETLPGYRPDPPYGIAPGAVTTTTGGGSGSGDGGGQSAMPAWAMPAILAGAQMMQAGESGMSPFGAIGQGLTTGLTVYAQTQAQAIEGAAQARAEGREERRLALEELEAQRKAGERNLTAITTSNDGVLRFYDRDTGEVIVATEEGSPVRLRQPGSGGGGGSGSSAEATAKTREIEYLMANGIPFDQARRIVYNDLGTATNVVNLASQIMEYAEYGEAGSDPASAVQMAQDLINGFGAGVAAPSEAGDAPVLETQEDFDAIPSGAPYREEPGGPIFIKP